MLTPCSDIVRGQRPHSSSPRKIKRPPKFGRWKFLICVIGCAKPTCCTTVPTLCRRGSTAFRGRSQSAVLKGCSCRDRPPRHARFRLARTSDGGSERDFQPSKGRNDGTAFGSGGARSDLVRHCPLFQLLENTTVAPLRVYREL